MVVAEVRLTDEEAERLEEIAREKAISVDELIHDAVKQRLSRPAEPTMDEKRRRALAIVGRYSSGMGDLGRNHDKYLAEDFAR